MIEKNVFFLNKIFLTEKELYVLISAVAQIAQSVEQGIENPRVGGSIPSLGTIFKFQNCFHNEIGVISFCLFRSKKKRKPFRSAFLTMSD